MLLTGSTYDCHITLNNACVNVVACLRRVFCLPKASC